MYCNNKVALDNSMNIHVDWFLLFDAMASHSDDFMNYIGYERLTTRSKERE
jgi:hypothetical protein